MSVNFLEARCQTNSSIKRFGLCDDPAPAQNPAYIDEDNGAKWIGVVENEYLYEATFTAIDHCIEIHTHDNKMVKRCDGLLTYDQTAIFVELKERNTKGNEWITDAEKQLRSTIHYFELTEAADDFNSKKAYIANNARPKFRASQSNRMEKFHSETGYVLRIENRIMLS